MRITEVDFAALRLEAEEDLLVEEGRRYAEMTFRHGASGLGREDLIRLCMKYRDGSIVGPDLVL